MDARCYHSSCFSFVEGAKKRDADVERLKHDIERLLAERDALRDERDIFKRTLDKRDAERDALKAAIQAVIDGTYPNPRSNREETGKCGHDVWWWEDCTQCVEEYLQAALRGEE